MGRSWLSRGEHHYVSGAGADARYLIQARDRRNGGNQRAGVGDPNSRLGRYKGPVPADPEQFREVFGRFATGVAVVTTAGPAGAGGMTANAMCSLSLQPLLALVCFENAARTLPIVREHGRFAINVLAAEQVEQARLFASKLPEREKLESTPHRLHEGVPLIDGALAWAICEVREQFAGGDHTIVIGEVIDLGLGEGEPLLFYGGRYRKLAASGESR